MDEKILTLHPKGKAGVNISKAKYDTVCAAILDTLRTHGDLSFGALNDHVMRALGGSFDGSISWYTISVQLDLEARGVLTRLPGKPPLLHLV